MKKWYLYIIIIWLGNFSIVKAQNLKKQNAFRFTEKIINLHYLKSDILLVTTQKGNIKLLDKEFRELNAISINERIDLSTVNIELNLLVVFNKFNDTLSIYDIRNWELLKTKHFKENNIEEIFFNKKHLFCNSSKQLTLLNTKTWICDSIITKNSNQFLNFSLINHLNRVNNHRKVDDFIKLNNKDSIHFDDLIKYTLISNKCDLAGSVSYNSRKIYIWDIKKKQIYKEINSSYEITSIQFSIDNQYLFYGNSIGEITIISIETGKKLHKLRLSINPIDIIKTNDSQTSLLITDKMGNVATWDIKKLNITYQSLHTSVFDFFNNSKIESRKEKRIALLIGISDYSKDKFLKNPVQDILKLADILKNKDFHVIVSLNPTLKQLKETITLYLDTIETYNDYDVTSFFYYSGHGLQLNLNEEPLIIPKDFPFQENINPIQYSYGLNNYLEEINNFNNTLNIIIFDACRNSYFKKYSTSNNFLSKRTNTESINYIVYSTAPGKKAIENGSPFFNCLLKYINSPINIKNLILETSKCLNYATSPPQKVWEHGPAMIDFYITPNHID